MNLVLIGFMVCRGAIGPLVSHQLAAIAENFSISASSTPVLPSCDLHLLSVKDTPKAQTHAEFRAASRY